MLFILARVEAVKSGWRSPLAQRAEYCYLPAVPGPPTVRRVTMRENEVVCREPPIVRLDDTQVIPQGCSSDASVSASPQKKNRLSLFWKISGGTILSVSGFVAMLLFEQYNNSLAELRNDLKHFNETS